MSDQGFSGPPPVTPPAASDTRPARGDVLKIVNTIGMIRDNARMQRLAGEIVAENKDGTLRIATPQGDITVQKPASRPDLVVGTKVDIEVPAGHPPRQITVRDTLPPQQTQQPQTLPPRSEDAPPPVVTAPPRPPVTIPAQPPAPPPQTTPAPVTPDLTLRFLPLPPQQAAQIIVPPTDIINTLLPAAPQVAAAQIAQAAPDELIAQLLRLPLSAPAPQLAAQQLANVIVPQMPPSAFVTPAPVMGALPPAVQNTAQAVTGGLLNLENAAAAPLLRFMPPVATPVAQNSFSLLTARIPPAMAAFAALSPENLIQGTPSLTPAAPSALALPKMDAQIISITPPTVTLSAPGTPPATPPMFSSNPFMPQTENAFTAPPAVPAGMLAAQVTGMTAQNFPVLSVAFPALNATQDFVMQFPADNIAPGASLTLQPPPGAPVAVTAAAATALPFTPYPEMMTTGLWPALDDAFQALQSAAPQTAHIMAQTAIPNTAAAPRMPAVIMMFVAAMQGGDLQNWLGDKTIDTLRRIGKADIIARLNRDGAAINRMAAPETAPAQDWRSMPVPMMWDNHIHKIMLHYRHDREASKDGEDKKKGTRFVLDIAPPRMGNVQLDGLHRPGENNGRLDLIVRTNENLSPPMQQAMRRLYVNALENAQLSGELSFQNQSGNWIRF